MVAVQSERWLRCAQKTCCSAYAVFPTGDELVGIARALRMPIEEIVVPLPMANNHAAYRLSPGGQPYRLALAHIRNGPDGSPACGFLVQLPDGVARCGLGPLRPSRCRTYPAVLRGGSVGIDAGGCTCGPWTVDELDSAELSVTLSHAAQAYTRYLAVIEAWNARLRVHAAHVDFFEYLRHAYAE